MKKIVLMAIVPLLVLSVVTLSFVSCDKEENITEQTNTQQPDDNQQPYIRPKYLVDSVTLRGGSSYVCKYEYDEYYRMKRRVLAVDSDIYIDTFEYSNGHLLKMTKSYNGQNLGYIDFFYDNLGRLVKSKYVDNVMCFGYHNGRMDSIFRENNPEAYVLLEYDERGNVVKERRHEAYVPTGRYYFTTIEYEYDTNPRPNYNLDEAFIYEPLFATGYVIDYIKYISRNNRIKSWNGHDTSICTYEYNEHNLPISMHSGSSTYKFTYIAVE